MFFTSSHGRCRRRWCLSRTFNMFPAVSRCSGKCLVLLGMFVLSVIAVHFIGNYLINQWEIRRLTNCQRNWKGSENTGTIAVKNNSSIFLVETTGRSTLNPRQACAVESAARHNRDANVLVLMMSSVEPKGKYVSTLSGGFQNINFVSMCPEFIFKDTPLFRWYKDGEWKRSHHWMREMSDATRYVLLWKYGGLYLDTDVIVLRRLDSIRNTLVLQDPGEIIGSSILSFTRRHPFIERCIADFSKSYKYDIFASVGPTLITETYKRMCSPDLHTLGRRKECDVSLFHPDTAFPVSWDNYQDYVTVESLGRVLGKIRNSSVVHLWGKYTNSVRLKVGVGTPYEVLMTEHCPSIYENIGDENYF